MNFHLKLAYLKLHFRPLFRSNQKLKSASHISVPNYVIVIDNRNYWFIVLKKILEANSWTFICSFKSYQPTTVTVIVRLKNNVYINKTETLKYSILALTFWYLPKIALFDELANTIMVTLYKYFLKRTKIPKKQWKTIIRRNV